MSWPWIPRLGANTHTTRVHGRSQWIALSASPSSLAEAQSPRSVFEAALKLLIGLVGLPSHLRHVDPTDVDQHPPLGILQLVLADPAVARQDDLQPQSRHLMD